MTFNPNAKLDPSQVQDVRGSGGGRFGSGGPMIIGGGGGIGIIILIVSLLLGVNPLPDASTALTPVEGGPSAQECQTGADANKRDDCRIVGFVDSIQKYWTDEFARRGQTYAPAQTILFSGQTQAGCGTASTAQGPFYCPVDQRVYLDLSFFQDLQTRFGAQGGPFAEGYVVAHEYGHHVQDLAGLLSAGGGGQGAQSASVRTELQADCLAGVWANHAAATGFLVAPTDTEIATAVDAAGAVGDDRIQKETQGRVMPDRFTHGTSAQRQQSFRTGYTSGQIEQCGLQL
ncbi:MAG: neutral zinc metallopeptidase [Candidatus Limnocylindria bacterium]